jgi:small-conductance mechanosensitive channel
MDNGTTAVTWFAYFLELTGSVEFSIIALLAAAILIAIILHAVAFTLLKSIMDRNGPGRLIVRRVSGPLQLAAILLALVIVLPAADFQPAIAETSRRFLKIGMAVLIGWSAIIGINAVSGWLERKNRIDVEDNLAARRVLTQIRILRRLSLIAVLILTVGAILVTFPSVQAYGVSLFASAGVAGIVLGFAARPILTNLIAGVQIALTQPIRIDDVVIVKGEWGWIEEITSTYVVVRIWDWRRLVVPLSHFIEQPFENWTRESAEIIGVVLWHVDYRTPIPKMREKLKEIVENNPLWDGNVVNLQVVDSGPTTLTVRALVSSRTSPKAWDLRCEVREAMVTWLRDEYPDVLPRSRAELEAVAMPNKALEALAR